MGNNAGGLKGPSGAKNGKSKDGTAFRDKLGSVSFNDDRFAGVFGGSKARRFLRHKTDGWENEFPELVWIWFLSIHR